MSSSTYESEIEIDRVTVKRALLSVYDKTGLEELARALHAQGVRLFSTGGTEQFLKQCGLPVTSVSDLTKSPEVFGGRLKTLHPLIHGGLLYRRELPSHVQEAAEHNIEAFDLLVVNLYPFEETVAKPHSTHQEIVEQIDIGGPAMLRSAAKNYRGVALLTSPLQYGKFVQQLEHLDGATELEFRFQLAREAFTAVADYDVAIAGYFQNDSQIPSGHNTIPPELHLDLPQIQSLRYGENPQQKAALYGNTFSQICSKLWGKELSYNNILDTSAALSLISDFLSDQAGTLITAIIKHTNPCGVAEGSTPLDAFERAFSTDPESPFGGIIITTGRIERDFAERLNQFFCEVVLAPEFSEEALEVLKKKKDRRLIRYSRDELRNEIGRMPELRSVVGGVLYQESDKELWDPNHFSSISALSSVTTHEVNDETRRGLQFAFRIVKHLKSNAIAYCGIEDGFARTLGLGAGQTSRVEASRIAVDHAKHHGLSLTGSFVASDAFFPFADGLIEAAIAGAVAAIEPGGSVRDEEVIAAAESNGMSLIMTGMRHFKH
jgi:phosphoribosylaminoimidazolecarboxamide formyltransferase/IMP cyclohydrolase